MAKASGLSVSTVQRIWRAFGLQPHRLETFKLSTDPDFVAKVRRRHPRFRRALLRLQRPRRSIVSPRTSDSGH